MMQVVETAYAGHAHALASTVDLSTCPDGNINFVSVFAVTYCTLLFHYLIYYYFIVYRYHMCWR